MSMTPDRFKSSYSEGAEATSRWTKSTYSAEQGECIEVAASATTIHVRDSKDITLSVLTFSAAAWTAFTQVARGADTPDPYALT